MEAQERRVSEDEASEQVEESPEEEELTDDEIVESSDETLSFLSHIFYFLFWGNSSNIICKRNLFEHLK